MNSQMRVVRRSMWVMCPSSHIVLLYVKCGVPEGVVAKDEGLSRAACAGRILVQQQQRDSEQLRACNVHKVRPNQTTRPRVPPLPRRRCRPLLPSSP